MIFKKKNFSFFLFLIFFLFFFLFQFQKVRGVNGGPAMDYIQGVTQQEVSPPPAQELNYGKIEKFLVYFCHFEVKDFTYGDASGAIDAPVTAALKMVYMLWCLFLYLISLPVRFIFFLIIIFFWILTWLIATLGNIISLIFIIIIKGSIYASFNVQNIEGTGDLWNFVKTIGNALVLLVAVFTGFATAAGLQEYHIKKHFGKLIALAILVNYSHWIVVLAADTSNKIAKPLFDALVEKGAQQKQAGEISTLGIISSIWNQQKKHPLKIDVPYEGGASDVEGWTITTLHITLDSAPSVMMDYLLLRNTYFFDYFLSNVILTITVCIYLFLFFVIFLSLTSIFIYFSLYGFLRIFILWILGIVAPIAFSTIIFERSKIYQVIFPGFFRWDKWLQMLLVWSFLIVPMCFIFYMGDKIQAGFEKSEIGNVIKQTMASMTTPGESTEQRGSDFLSNAINNTLKTFAELAPVIVLFLFYVLSFAEIKEQVKQQVSVITGELTKGASAFGATGGLVLGLTAGALIGGGALVGGALSGLGAARVGSAIAKTGSVIGKGISVFGGARARQMAQSAADKSERIKKGTESVVEKATSKEGLKEIGGKIMNTATTGVGALGGAAAGMLLAGPLGAIVGAAAGGSLLHQLRKSKKLGETTKRIATGTAGGALAGSIFGPLGTAVGAVFGGFAGGLGKKMIEKWRGPRIKPNYLEQYEQNKLREGSSLYRNYYEDQVREVLANPEAPFPQKFGAYMRLTTPREMGGLEIEATDQDKERLRESASKTISDKKASPLERVAAAKILTESNQPLTQKEIDGIKRILPSIDLDPTQTEDRAFIEKLVAKAPASLASTFGISQRNAVQLSKTQGNLTKLPIKELEGVFDELKTDDIRTILEQGGEAQKAKIIELTLEKKFNIRVKPDINVNILEEQPERANEILSGLRLKLISQDPKSILEDKLKEEGLSHKEKREEIEKMMNLWDKMIEST